MQPTKPSRSTQTGNLILCALFAALTAVCSQIQIPLPMIPINLALFAVFLAGALLGPRFGSASMVVYLLLGAIGVPVFAGFGGGPGILLGKTGGYLLGYILAAGLTGFLSRKWGFSFLPLAAAMLLGAGVCYLFGTVWFMVVTGSSLWMSLLYCVFPFLPGDAVKIALASVLALKLKQRLRKNWNY